MNGLYGTTYPSSPEWDEMVRERQYDEVLEEISRDHHIAAHAAEQIANNVPLRDIAQEGLEALETWINQELMDRDACAAEDIRRTVIPF